MSERKIVLNRIKTPDGTILTSYHRHNYVSYADNGELYAVDGGNDYLSRKGSNYEDLTVYIDDSFEKVRESFHRYNNRENKYVSLKDMSDEWLENLITYLEPKQSDEEFPKHLYLKESEYRKIENRDKVIDSL